MISDLRNNRNTLIVGSKGTGKTQLIKQYIKNINKFILIDFYGQYNEKYGYVFYVKNNNYKNISKIKKYNKVIINYENILNNEDVIEIIINTFSQLRKIIFYKKVKPIFIIDECVIFNKEKHYHLGMFNFLQDNNLKVILGSQKGVEEFKNGGVFSGILSYGDVIVDMNDGSCDFFNNYSKADIQCKYLFNK